MSNKSVLSRWVAKTSGYQKLLFSFLFALCVSIAITPLHISTVTLAIFCWDVFAIAMIGMMWLLFFTTTAKEQQGIVKKQDDDIKVIFAIVLISVCISLVGTLLLIFSTGGSTFERELRTVITLIAICSSWILLHTIFTIRYAHLYHIPNSIKTEDSVESINFPNSETPDYIDFAYFSFVIGMTFQVSDVTISSKKVRRFVLLHSLISFVFNTIIVALTVNTIASISR